MLDTTHADAIVDEGAALLADALPNSTEGVAFSAAFQAKGLHFRPPAQGWGAISDEGVASSADSSPMSYEGVAFSAAFQAKGLHFRPLARGGVHF